MFYRLIHWVRSFFIRRERFDLYHPKERDIYHYWNGKEEVSVDPMVLYRTLMNVGPELSVDMSVANSRSKDAVKAGEKALGKIRNVFGVKPLSEGGLTELETFEVLDHFLIYCESIKKNSSPSVILPSNIPPSSPPSIEPSPPTSSSLDSGSIVEGSDGGKPIQSPSEPPLPSA